MHVVLPVSDALLPAAAALAAALLVALPLHWRGGRGHWMVLLVPAGAALLAARLGYGLLHAGYYAAQPLELLKPWKDGLLPWAGVLAALLAALLMSRRVRPGAPALLPVLAGVTAGTITLHTINTVGDEIVHLPPLALETLTEESVTLTAYQGRPLAINLWASWCPPCRQEMPALEASQDRHPEIGFLFVNQGEEAEVIARYLSEEDLALAHVLRDPGSSASKRLDAAALPTTLFFDSAGQLVSAHTGELTPPRLEDHLRALLPHRH